MAEGTDAMFKFPHLTSPVMGYPATESKVGMFGEVGTHPRPV